ncbi:MAG: antibiotic biosynthesis monooxygenase family protein [Nitriliruptoraceae bacterium]
MSIVKINAIKVPHGGGDQLEERFAARAGEVEHVDGFESFELLRPTDGSHRYLVVTRWRDAAAYDAWAHSDAFAASHGANHFNDPTVGHPGAASASEAAPSGPTEGHPGAASASVAAPSGPTVGHPGAASAPEAAPSGPAEGHPGAGSRGEQEPASELWSYEVVVSAQASTA